MSNDLVYKRNWWERNWKWFLAVIVLALGIWLFLISVANTNSIDVVQAYSENALYENALAKVNTNDEAISILGNLEPLDQLAILEGSAKYSTDKQRIETTVRIKGSKAKGKMDISAFKKGNNWQYEKINIRINSTKEVISIVK
ncbi:cytochrome c oxidase assembly factor Coa1 family protein [Flavobacterium degerlachei]|jgi:predicted negative regulator of RcsB-dependent stress response|uniref:Cytochrome oxidase complex assembly protein 1 n=1 Tax=Flavobacterium degerlachei TaxID=229203 RepID=A0A1H2U6R0_9FLAO|nr:cytochrome c oxidase assembly factor Coa1 family protein [Flavobacterium degerlachei]SDW51558.1 Cytochrome oxidase complex assembly protein 1 [Flavobacterium degerlachei]